MELQDTCFNPKLASATENLNVILKLFLQVDCNLARWGRKRLLLKGILSAPMKFLSLEFQGRLEGKPFWVLGVRERSLDRSLSSYGSLGLAPASPAS